ncbi:MAG TPA: CAP domain-containing protein, partial [Acidimicrobiales bacterium]|nr:CAP domain-containing protein [Acidimicrobiales bacterium]
MNSKKIRIAMGAGLASVMAVTVVPEPAFADTGSDEASFVAKLNGLRASKGLRQLGVHGGLTSMARGWSSQMASRGTISHNPNLAAQAPSNWVRVGENVGMGPSVDSLHNAFVNSPSHYANMVNGYYDSVGVGIVQSGSTIFVTFNFMASGAAPQVAAAAPVRHFAPPPAPAAAPPAARRVCRKVRSRTVCRTVKA